MGEGVAGNYSKKEDNSDINRFIGLLNLLDLVVNFFVNIQA